MAEHKVLVTGSSGALGRFVVADLLAADYAVVAADRVLPESSLDGVHAVTWDGRDVAALATAMDGCSALIHLAAIPHPGDHPAEVVFGNNTGATFAALQAAAQVGITNVAIASSVSAYGMPWSPRPTQAIYVPIDEAHPMRNYDPYGLSKEVDERTAQMFVRQYEMSIAALRFHWIATREAQLERVAALRGNQDWDAQIRELWGYIDVRDAARACRLAIEVAAERPFGFEPMQIVAADTLTDVPLAELLAEHAPKMEVRPGLSGGAGAFSIDRAREVIGWSPQHSWRARP
jgi:nucleoside-diphosphate-sugar epimerase